MEKIREFINNNELLFTEGNRNTTVVTLIGYAQYVGLTQKQLELQLENEIEEDSFIETEIQRLWSYCASNNYKKYWSTAEATKAYNF